MLKIYNTDLQTNKTEKIVSSQNPSSGISINKDSTVTVCIN